MPFLLGEFVSDVSKSLRGTACPRCQTSMREVTRVEPLQKEAGLIAYECSACGYVMSVILPAAKQTDDHAP